MKSFIWNTKILPSFDITRIIKKKKRVIVIFVAVIFFVVGTIIKLVVVSNEHGHKGIETKLIVV